MTGLEELTKCIKKLSADAVNTLLDAVKILLASQNTTGITDCPYCNSTKAIRYGHKCGKQRFLCKHCGRTFVTTTHTIMSQSHFSEAVWQEVISDTVQGNAIDYSAKKLGINHRTIFDMRHKILLALQELPETEHILLDGVSELDETFVLECFKGKPLPETVGRKARKHGAKAQNVASPANTTVSVPVSSAKGKPMLPRSTGQNRMQRNWQAFLRTISPKAPWYSATGLKVTTAFPQLQAVR